MPMKLWTAFWAGCILVALSLGMAQAANMKIESPAFANGGMIPGRFTCKGANVSPELLISGIPAKAKVLALVVEDPDAPMGTWTHWLVWNIPPSTARIPENAIPTGAVQGTNDFGKPQYGGPCPPFGSHRYYFKLYALDKPMALKAGAKRETLLAALKGHVLGQAVWMGRFQK